MIDKQSLYYSIENVKPNAAYLLSNKLSDLIRKSLNNHDIIILCIGTDRSTGDCLGPLVGHKLNLSYIRTPVHIFGNLNQPVHAKNLDENIDYIYSNFEKPFVIAIDASLGKSENVGRINIYTGPIQPGAGVNKNLRPIGDISITGIVNISGFMEFLVLQNTRLSLVMGMADTIALGLKLSINSINIDEEGIF